MKMFFAPDGTPITRPVTCSFNCPDIEVQDDGTAGQGSFDDFPTFEMIEFPGLGTVLNDMDGEDWLEQHCRLIEVDEYYDVWDDKRLEPPAWDDEIVATCRRVQWLGSSLWAVEKFKRWSPTDIVQDPTIDTVLNTIIVGRVQAEIDRHMATIAAYRKGRVEPSTLVEPEPEDELETALGMMRGGVS